MPSSRRDLAEGDRRTPAVETMEEDDLDQVLDIERLSFPTPWSRESFLFELRENPFACNVVLREDGRVIAFACVWIVDRELKINNIAVHTAHRGKGLGSRLLSWLLGKAKDRGCDEATLEVRPSNRAALRLYERHGFREVSRRPGYYRDTREDAIVMAAPIS